MLSTACRKVASTSTLKNLLNVSIAKMSSTFTYETLQVTVPKPFVYHVELNRPTKMNAINPQMWDELSRCFENLNCNPECRAVILSGSGKAFTAGIDLNSLNFTEMSDEDDLARKAKMIHSTIVKYQNSLSTLEKCCKPVIGAIHSACIGAGVDAITATDMRYCTKDAYFQVKETIIGMAADVGTLQRLPKIIGSDSFVRELCFTGRKLPAEEALRYGLVSKVFENKESMLTEVLKVAEDIAAKSPVAVQTTKISLNYSRDHNTQDGLNHIALLNQFMLQSEDFATAVMAQLTKEPAIFSKL